MNDERPRPPAGRDEVRLEDLEKDIGHAEEMSEHDRARLGLAKWLLGALGAILILSGVALIFGPTDRIEQSKLIFEYVKTSVPPLVTLVIGFYFRNAGGS